MDIQKFINEFEAEELKEHGNVSDYSCHNLHYAITSGETFEYFWKRMNSVIENSGLKEVRIAVYNNSTTEVNISLEDEMNWNSITLLSIKIERKQKKITNTWGVTRHEYYLKCIKDYKAVDNCQTIEELAEYVREKCNEIKNNEQEKIAEITKILREKNITLNECRNILNKFVDLSAEGKEKVESFMDSLT